MVQQRMQQRLFEDLLDSDVRVHKTKQGYTLPVSIAIHVLVLLAVVIVPLMTAEVLPEPTSVVKAFFVEPAAAPPPPPPPPPPAPKAAVQPRVAPTPPPMQDDKFTAPVVTPDEVKPDEGIDLGVEGGGGVEGGVPGGVVGGIVGGLPDAPPPPAAVRVGGQIKEPKKLKNVTPVYPDIAKQARVQGIVILECTISPQGKVTDVKVLRGIPLLDAAAIDAVKQWVYSPTLLNGVPVPVIMTVTVNFRLS
jgi:periplasmic protein TonB